MATYTKISELTAGSALGGTEPIPMVQSSATVYVTPAQISTYVHANPAGVSNTSVITGEYIFDEDAELDYSASFTDGMSAATVTFSELPSATKAVWVYVYLGDTGVNPYIGFKRTSGGTQQFYIYAEFADSGTNKLMGTYWIPTDGNTIYATGVNADTTSEFRVLGYKTGQ